MNPLLKLQQEAREEFDGSYGDFFTETPNCKGCKNSFEGDTRHRRHCIADAHDFLDNLVSKSYNAGRSEMREELRSAIVSNKAALTMKWDSDKQQSWAYDKLLTLLDEAGKENNN